MEQEYYVILTTTKEDTEFGGNAHMFWGREGRAEYTPVLQRAGLYTKQRAYDYCGTEDVPIPISKLGFDKDFFESKKKEIQMPILYAKTIESRDIIVDWQYEYRHGIIKRK